MGASRDNSQGISSDLSLDRLVTTSSPFVPPRHVAIVMDGNGRWAQSRGLPRLEGHKAGAGAVRRVVEACCKRGIRYLTLFSFSTENWQRSKPEVSGLMTLFRKHLESELTKLLENGIRLRAIGALERLPDSVLAPLQRDIESTKENKTLDLILAVSYGGREEIAASCRKIAEKVQQGVLAPEDVTVDEVARNLYAPDVPDPDLLIRSSGEQRISNFLLWQLAYSEIVVTPEYWPDFDEEVLDRCLADYAARERRFGLTSEQVREQRKRSSAGSA